MTRSTNTSYTMLYNELYSSGSTTSPVFALYMAEDTQQSTIQFGGYDTTYLKNPAAGIMYLALADNSLFWNVNIDGFKVGTNSKLKNGAPNGYYLTYYSIATLDSGTSLMLVPIELYQSLMDMMLHGVDTSYKYGYYWVDCTDAGLESLYILVGNQYLEVTPSAYLIKAGNGLCVIGIQQSTDHSWLLGDLFLKNFYSVWDDSINAIALAPHKTSASSALTTN